jgi:predicted O-linked N-acetylglucosamine transferase (SPINDLY family)
LLANLLKRMLPRRPPSAQELVAKGTALLNAGAWQDATACFEAALRAAPRDPMLLNNLGLCHANAGKLDAAAACFREVLRLTPDAASALMNLGNIDMFRAQPAQAALRYEAAAALAPNDPALMNNLGMAYQATAQIDAAIRSFRKALSLDPRCCDAHENLLLCMQLLPEYGAAAIHAEHRNWAGIHAAPLQPENPAYANDRDPHRRLRVGYVSPDFRRHAVAKFIEPLIAHHDRDRYRIHCYHNARVSDAGTDRIRPFAEVWRDVAQLSDESLAAQISADRIDILVDLAGHTRGGRLRCFARRPAPLQITYLGYPNTTGMDAMDYRLTDAVADPVGVAERFHSERLLRLPQAQWCFRPDAEALPVNPLPALAAGGVTFGSFNKAAKINAAVVGAWSRILLRTPGSRLMMIGLAEESTRARFQAMFAAHGVDASRLALHPSVSDAEFWRLRQQVDAALDPFPYNGVTSTCEALWSGTPMPALLGTCGQSRCAASLLTSLGLTELIARTEDEYVEIGVKLASDLGALAALRSSLRARMQSSALMDYAAFARALEGLYRAAWIDWVERHPASA